MSCKCQIAEVDNMSDIRPDVLVSRPKEHVPMKASCITMKADVDLTKYNLKI